MIKDSEIEEESDSDDEEIARYARRFRWFIKKNKPWKKNKNQISKDEPKKEFKKDSKKENSIIYYNCNKPGHVKQECTLPKKYFKYSKKKKERP